MCKALMEIVCLIRIIFTIIKNLISAVFFLRIYFRITLKSPIFVKYLVVFLVFLVVFLYLQHIFNFTKTQQIMLQRCNSHSNVQKLPKSLENILNKKFLNRDKIHCTRFCFLSDGLHFMYCLFTQVLVIFAKCVCTVKLYFGALQTQKEVTKIKN